MADTSLLFRILGRDVNASSTLARVSKALKTFRDGVDESSRDVRTLGTAMSSLGKPTALLAAAGAATQLAAALGPATGALLALPAAAGVGAAAMVTARIATVGLSDAMEALAEGDAAAVKEAMAELPPAARQVVRAAHAVREQFDGIRRSVQQRLFRGLSGEITTLANTQLPILRTGLTGVGGSLNTLAKEALRVAATPFMRGVVADVLASTSTVLDSLQPAVGGLARAVGAVVKAGLPFVEQLAAWVGRSLQAAGAFLSSAEGAAWLRTKLEEGKRALMTLVSIAGNVKSALSGIFRAAGANELLTTIDQLTAKFATWANSVGGQQKLQQLFTSLTEIARALIAAVTQMAGPLGVIANLFLSMPAPLQTLVASTLAWSLLLGKLTSAFAPLIAVLGRLGGLFLGTGTKSATAAATTKRSAASIVASWLKIAVKSAAHALKVAGSWLLVAGINAGAAVAATAAAAVKIIARWTRMALVAAARAAMMAASWLVAMGPVGWAIAAVAAVAAAVILNWDKIVKWTKKIWAAVSGFVTRAWEWIKNAVGAAATWVWRKVKGAFTAAKDWAIRKARELVGWVAGLPGRILSALGDLGSLLVSAGRNLIEGLWSGIRAMGTWLKNKIIGFIKSFVPGPVLRFLGISSPSKLFAKIGRQVGAGLAMGIGDSERVVAAAATRLAGKTVPDVIGMRGEVTGGRAQFVADLVGSLTDAITAALANAPITVQSNLSVDGKRLAAAVEQGLIELAVRR